jgi:hypothetical protein
MAKKTTKNASAPAPPTQPEGAPVPDTSEEEREIARAAQRYRDDIRRMMGYCRDQGIPVPKAIESEMEVAFPTTDKAVPDRKVLQVLVHAHGQLSQTIKLGAKAEARAKVQPTPRSLAATDFSRENLKRDERPWWTLALLLFLFVMAVIGVAGYIRTVPKLSPVASDPNDGAAKSPTTTQNTTVGNNVGQRAGGDDTGDTAVAPNPPNYLFAAMLGAALNGLLTLQLYIRNRTFEPRYACMYVIRFTVGVIAGMVLACVGSDLFSAETTLAKLGPGAIALLGGYSAEAVRQILDRLVEVLLTVVGGREVTSSPAPETDEKKLPGPPSGNLANTAKKPANTKSPAAPADA